MTKTQRRLARKMMFPFVAFTLMTLMMAIAGVN